MYQLTLMKNHKNKHISSQAVSAWNTKLNNSLKMGPFTKPLPIAVIVN